MTPYPSIPIQDLVQILRDGDRMAKPLNCPDELYDIMMVCWNENATERPRFDQIYSSLTMLLDTNANKEVDYVNVYNEQCL